MVNDQIDRHKRVDLLGVATEAGNCRAHRCQIYYSRDSGKVLHDHSRRQKRNAGACTFRRPGSDVLDVALPDLFVVTLTESRLEDDSDGKRKPLEVRETRLFQRIQTIDNVFL